MGWSAGQYGKFLDQRTRPARDLLAGVPLTQAGRVVDIGSGPGNSTGLLVARFPDAHVTGLDADPDMIATARRALPGCAFHQARVEDWHPDVPPDLIFANASLQWVDDHHSLFPRLVGLLAPGGVLAVQMPDNLDEPTHIAMRDVADDPRWRDRLLGAAARRKPLIRPADLHALLRPYCAQVDIWQTVYHFDLAGVDAIGEWFKGSALPPYLAPLTAAEQDNFMAAWRDQIAPHYPETDGRVLLAFPRYFLVAQTNR